jgi:hypothetical protein
MRIFGRRGLALTVAAATMACVPREARAAPVPAPAPVDWQIGPLSPGDWSYVPDRARPYALFRAEGAAFRLICEPNRTISLVLAGGRSASVLIRTSFGERRLSASRAGAHEIAASLPASDPLLDQMAFSRGRFLVQAEGGPALVVPAWPEPAHVIEDCRGQ